VILLQIEPLLGLIYAEQQQQRNADLHSTKKAWRCIDRFVPNAD